MPNPGRLTPYISPAQITKLLAWLERVGLLPRSEKAPVKSTRELLEAAFPRWAEEPSVTRLPGETPTLAGLRKIVPPEPPALFGGPLPQPLTGPGRYPGARPAPPLPGADVGQGWEVVEDVPQALKNILEWYRLQTEAVSVPGVRPSGREAKATRGKRREELAATKRRLEEIGERYGPTATEREAREEFLSQFAGPKISPKGLTKEGKPVLPTELDRLVAEFGEERGPLVAAVRSWAARRRHPVVERGVVEPKDLAQLGTKVFLETPPVPTRKGRISMRAYSPLRHALTEELGLFSSPLTEGRAVTELRQAIQALEREPVLQPSKVLRPRRLGATPPPVYRVPPRKVWISPQAGTPREPLQLTPLPPGKEITRLPSAAPREWTPEELAARLRLTAKFKTVTPELVAAVRGGGARKAPGGPGLSVDASEARAIASELGVREPARELDDLLAEALSRLAPEEQTLLQLRFGLGGRLQTEEAPIPGIVELGKTLGIRTSKVKERLTQALQRLKVELERIVPREEIFPGFGARQPARSRGAVRPEKQEDQLVRWLRRQKED